MSVDIGDRYARGFGLPEGELQELEPLCFQVLREGLVYPPACSTAHTQNSRRVCHPPSDAVLANENIALEHSCFTLKTAPSAGNDCYRHCSLHAQR